MARGRREAFVAEDTALGGCEGLRHDGQKTARESWPLAHSTSRRASQESALPYGPS
jgi:hypothetical protein